MKIRLLMTSAFVLGMAAPAFAQDTMIISKDAEDSVITGLVSEVRGDTIIIMNEGKVIKIDLGDLDLDRSAKDLIEPGMQVTARGQFEDFGATPVFKAESVMRTSTNANSNIGALPPDDDDDVGDVDIEDTNANIGTITRSNAAPASEDADQNGIDDDSVRNDRADE
jgi:hypothetical protein